jgi:hypothetical protein
MKTELKNNVLTVTKEKGDKPIYTESAFFYALKNVLNGQGYNLVKKSPDKDGHMLSAPYYLRDRKWRHCFTDDLANLRALEKEYRIKGEVKLYYTEWEE